jgi:DNA-binding transcriptional ArsR family regulator
MPRLATTADVFNAVAEPQRRAIISVLAAGEQSVGDLTEQLTLQQPQVSKHLKVLKEVEVVHVRKAGKQRFYSLNATKLKPIHDWVASFEHLWNERFDRLETYLDTLQSEPEQGEKDDYDQS